MLLGGFLAVDDVDAVGRLAAVGQSGAVDVIGGAGDGFPRGGGDGRDAGGVGVDGHQGGTGRIVGGEMAAEGIHRSGGGEDEGIAGSVQHVAAHRVAVQRAVQGVGIPRAAHGGGGADGGVAGGKLQRLATEVVEVAPGVSGHGQQIGFVGLPGGGVGEEEAAGAIGAGKVAQPEPVAVVVGTLPPGYLLAGLHIGHFLHTEGQHDAVPAAVAVGAQGGGAGVEGFVGFQVEGHEDVVAVGQCQAVGVAVHHHVAVGKRGGHRCRAAQHIEGVGVAVGAHLGVGATGKVGAHGFLGHLDGAAGLTQCHQSVGAPHGILPVLLQYYADGHAAPRFLYRQRLVGVYLFRHVGAVYRHPVDAPTGVGPDVEPHGAVLHYVYLQTAVLVVAEGEIGVALGEDGAHGGVGCQGGQGEGVAVQALRAVLAVHEDVLQCVVFLSLEQQLHSLSLRQGVGVAGGHLAVGVHHMATALDGEGEQDLASCGGQVGDMGKLAPSRGGMVAGGAALGHGHHDAVAVGAGKTVQQTASRQGGGCGALGLNVLQTAAALEGGPAYVFQGGGQVELAQHRAVAEGVVTYAVGLLPYVGLGQLAAAVEGSLGYVLQRGGQADVLQLGAAKESAVAYAGHRVALSAVLHRAGHADGSPVGQCVVAHHFHGPLRGGEHTVGESAGYEVGGLRLLKAQQRDYEQEMERLVVHRGVNGVDGVCHGRTQGKDSTKMANLEIVAPFCRSVGFIYLCIQ